MSLPENNFACLNLIFFFIESPLLFCESCLHFVRNVEIALEGRKMIDPRAGILCFLNVLETLEASVSVRKRRVLF